MELNFVTNNSNGSNGFAIQYKAGIKKFSCVFISE